MVFEVKKEERRNDVLYSRKAFVIVFFKLSLSFHWQPAVACREELKKQEKKEKNQSPAFLPSFFLLWSASEVKQKDIICLLLSEREDLYLLQFSFFSSNQTRERKWFLAYSLTSFKLISSFTSYQISSSTFHSKTTNNLKNRRRPCFLKADRSLKRREHEELSFKRVSKTSSFLSRVDSDMKSTKSFLLFLPSSLLLLLFEGANELMEVSL